MNCTHIKKVIPLYVGGDLNTREAAGVRKHIETCERCRDLVAEFEESRSWLRDFTAPQFDEAVFENLRDAVREEISRRESRPSLFDLLAPVWNLRSVIAASSALVLLTAGLLLYTNRPKSPDRPLTISGPVSIEGQNHGVIANTGPVSQIRRRKLATAHRSRRKTETNLPVVALNNHFGGSELTLPTHSDITTKQDAYQDPDQEMLRIEIQTADPNIRIIWIAPKNRAVASANSSPIMME
jgi:anti-sigma-K factor RskA